jgi:hypothetical protein
MFMTGHQASTTRRSCRLRIFHRSAFSLVEVMAASCVLMLGLGGTVLTIQTSLQTINHSRHLGAASQIMQSEIERLRLNSWDQLQSIQNSGDNTVATEGLPTGSNLSCTRRITDIRDGLKEITIETHWGGGKTTAHSARIVTRYARGGLNDYFYTSH